MVFIEQDCMRVVGCCLQPSLVVLCVVWRCSAVAAMTVGLPGRALLGVGEVLCGYVPPWSISQGWMVLGHPVVCRLARFGTVAYGLV